MFVIKNIASRSDIWNIYLTHYPIKMFNAEPKIKLDGINTILENSALDDG